MTTVPHQTSARRLGGRPIYLFKSARRPIYRKENLDLLAAERGSVQEYAWNRTWVALVADRYETRERWEDASQVMLELAWESMAHGHLEDASEAVERARGLWSQERHDEPSPEIHEATRRITAAWEEMAELVEWRKTAEERRRQRLRERLLNRTILVAGGLRNPEWVEHLEELTGAAVEWCQAHHDETDDLDGFAEKIRNGQYAVVLHYLQKTGHGTGEVLKPACEDAGVGFVHTTTAGRRRLVEALEGWIL